MVVADVRHRAAARPSLQLTVVNAGLQRPCCSLPVCACFLTADVLLCARWQASIGAHLAGAVATLVVCEAVHMCMVARGVEKHASSTVTCAARGACKADGELRSELLKILNSASFC